MNERTLYSLLRQKDRRALLYLYDNYSPAIYGEIMRMVNDSKAADDILQEVFVTIWKTSNQFDADKLRFFSWVMCVVRNKCHEHKKQLISSPVVL